MTRGMALLLGSALAGLLVWTAAQIKANEYTGSYWAALALLGAAGLVLGLARLLKVRERGTIVLSRPAFGLGFLPALIVGGWVLIAAQPNGNWFRGHVRDWSTNIHVGSVVHDLGTYAPVLAFGLGALLAFALDRVFASAAAPPPAARERADDVEPAPAAPDDGQRVEEREPAAVGGRTTGEE